VLLRRRKVAGVLAEAHWQAGQMAALILGIGVNVAPASVASIPISEEGELAFPATCVECVSGRPVKRWDLLRGILEGLLDWRARLAEPEFLSAWEARLAFRGEIVRITGGKEEPIEGELLGLTLNCGLRLRLAGGKERSFQFGELKLRPVDSSDKSAKLSIDEQEA
jgi:BirA family biotin operon repressor/biotin-[acetyl-CoA-carboxylase] ligase